MHDPRVPETVEGWSVLHQMFRVRWDLWRERPDAERRARATESVRGLAEMYRGEGGSTAITTLLGHKADLMLVHFRKSFDDLQAAQLRIARLGISPFLEPTTSYVSVVELGMYEMTAQIHGRLAEKGLAAGSPEFEAAFDAEIQEQRKRMLPRLFQEIPPRRYVCFYPMSKRRGEEKNWYAVPVEERARMMRDHGVIGRHYAGAVTQVISGSIGFDDWEWGVDLFADDPVVFKKLIYEMRFDEASAWYAEFGPFYVGLQFSPAELSRYLEGEVPAFSRAPDDGRLEEVHLSPSLRSHFADYAAFHATPGNQTCHYLGVPLIVFTLVALLTRVPVAVFGGFDLTLAEIVVGAATLWYLTLDVPLALVMLAASAAFAVVGRAVPTLVCLGLFVLGWVFQFIGHYVYEKKSPAFYKNLGHLLVGPLWIVAKATRRA